VNEIADRIEAVLMAAARRRAMRRHRRAVLAIALLGVLLLVSGASAVTGVGPLGDALTADEKLPPGAKPDPRGESVLLVGEGAEGRRYEVRAYRLKPKRHGRFRDLPGTYRYCVASYSAIGRARRDPNHITCTLGTAFARKLTRKPLWLECSSRGGVAGVPAPPDAVCGLTLAGTKKVTIEPDRGTAGVVRLSRPFPLRVNHEPEIVAREGLTEADVAGLPRILRVRAVLGVIEAPPTLPGTRTPRVEVTAVDSDGSRFTRHIGGRRVMTTADMPPLDPTPLPGGPRTEVSVSGRADVRWTTRTWRSVVGAFCASAVPEGVPEPELRDMYMIGKPSLSSCIWPNELGRFRSIVRTGAAGAITRAPKARSGGGQAVYGLARADVHDLRVRDTSGRLWPAALSEPWTTWRRRPNDLAATPRRFRPRFAGLPRSVRVRAFIAVLPADSVPRYPVRLRFKSVLGNGALLLPR
jgi:hypothetical protein